MFRLLSRQAPLALALAVSTGIPVLVALVRMVQIPSGTYPEDSARLAVATFAWFAHVLTATAFGLTGPLQFVRALRHRFWGTPPPLWPGLRPFGGDAGSFGPFASAAGAIGKTSAG